MSSERRWATDLFQQELLMQRIAAAESALELELIAAEARAALVGHPDLPYIEGMISANQRVLSRAHALLDEITQCEAGEETWW